METVRLTIEKLVHRGLGLAREAGKVWLVPLTVPGDVVDAVAVRTRPSMVEGRVTRVIAPGPERVEPACPWFGRCGGCHLQHVAMDRQASYKAAVLSDTFRRIAGVAVEPDRIVEGPLWGYRSRIELHAVDGDIGFFAPQSHEVVPVTACPIAMSSLSERLPALRESLRLGIGSTEFSVELISGAGNTMVALGRSPSDRGDRLLAMLIGLPGVTGAAVGGRDQWREWGDLTVRWPTLAGRDRPIEATADARCFSQANARLNRELVGTVLDIARPQRGERVIELYAGSGNLTMSLAAAGCDVRAVEVDGPALEAAERNLNTHVPGTVVRHVTGRVEKVLPRLAAQGPWDLVVADPPRTGMEDAVTGLVALEPGRIVMVSCEPATAARDVARLMEAGYRLDACVLVDMFPQTYHMEMVLGLRK